MFFAKKNLEGNKKTLFSEIGGVVAVRLLRAAVRALRRHKKRGTLATRWRVLWLFLVVVVVVRTFRLYDVSVHATQR